MVLAHVSHCQPALAGDPDKLHCRQRVRAIRSPPQMQEVACSSPTLPSVHNFAHTWCNVCHFPRLDCVAGKGADTKHKGRHVIFQAVWTARRGHGSDPSGEGGVDPVMSQKGPPIKVQSVHTRTNHAAQLLALGYAGNACGCGESEKFAIVSICLSLLWVK